jgi:predicted aldo/keto reductase-like oxidoreductase
MPRYRNHFFLATKTQERTYQAAYDQIRKSLERLQVDHVDLLQLHYLVDPHEWEVAMGPGGALEAAIRAREEGLTRFIGVTGHDVPITRMHRKSLERFDFDSVLLPYNYTMRQNPQYAAEFETLMTICKDRNIAVQIIKSLARGAWPEGAERTQATWYEPITELADMEVAVGWVLARPGVFVNTSGDIHLLPKMLEAASRYTATPTDEQMKAVVDRLKMTPLFV